ncbi:hypothetical protein EUGRSUZ_A00255 [Eucalyptus grandis]|uniref:Uncharacterized protein n=2 Tax=Eucalyptus grandis TaxID=71139 RepID=A0ACC3LZF7_EUCGR|nr:hypothetical protein EUGRSUZ_A00255 [Eucalyptus grandis]
MVDHIKEPQEKVCPSIIFVIISVSRNSFDRRETATTYFPFCLLNHHNIWELRQLKALFRPYLILTQKKNLIQTMGLPRIRPNPPGSL